MTDAVNNRLKELDELAVYLKNVETETTILLQSLNWDKKHLQKNEILSTCPIDGGHRLPESKLGAHMVKCKLRSEGYTDDDILLPDLPVSSHSSSVVNLGSPTEVSSIIDTILNRGKETGPVERPIPQTSGRIQTTYTQDERRAIYDYVAATARSGTNADELHMFGAASESQSGEHKSYLERLADKRDSKRRRTKYKKVSTKSKSHTEVLREVIKNQMEAFTEVTEETVKNELVEENIDQTSSQDEKTVQKSKNLCTDYRPKRDGDYSRYDGYNDDSRNTKNIQTNEENAQKSKNVFEDYHSKKSKDYRRYDNVSDDSDSKNRRKQSYDYRKPKYEGNHQDSSNDKKKKPKHISTQDLHSEKERSYRDYSHSDDDNTQRKCDDYQNKPYISSIKRSNERKDRRDRYGDDSYNNRDAKRKYYEKESSFHEKNHHITVKDEKRDSETEKRYKRSKRNDSYKGGEVFKVKAEKK